MPGTCERCKRETPSIGAPEWGHWENVMREDGSFGVICPGCLTVDERRIIELADEDYRHLADDEIGP